MNPVPKWPNDRTNPDYKTASPDQPTSSPTSAIGRSYDHLSFWILLFIYIIHLIVF